MRRRSYATRHARHTRRRSAKKFATGFAAVLYQIASAPRLTNEVRVNIQDTIASLNRHGQITNRQAELLNDVLNTREYAR